MYGFTVGAFKNKPYQFFEIFYKQFITKEFDKDVRIDPLYEETNVSSLISIENKNDIIKKRNMLIRYIWKGKTFPHSKLPDSIEKDITDKKYSDLSNLKSIDKITIVMEHGVNSIVYHFHPKKENNRLIIYHQGHEGNFILGKNTIQFFLEKGYSVIAFTMPLLGMNNQPIVNTGFGKIKLTSHRTLWILDNDGFSSIKFFVEPIAVSLNYIEENFDYDLISMTGLSGGAWTTTLYSAIDQRISSSYPVAGTLPIFSHSKKDIGDYEQNLPELYRLSNYLELYILASYGNNRNQLQILNKFDSCCFSGIKSTLYEEEVKKTLSSLGKGKFAVYLDDSHKEHKISDKALKIILADLEKDK